ncbi:MAG: SET domain-containing protein-lysine N-methyltransferase [Saprospiraceae bacterium]|nr:SET domain-containing protein-lysine N-methyltransferase [Saprospiraceae bacterium]
MAQRLPSVYFSSSTIEGRGVFTYEPIEEGMLIEICPAIVMPAEDLPVIHRTHLHDYYFLWGQEEKQCAIALGFGSLYNHSYEPNAEYVFDYEQQTIDIYSLKPIEAGEEITINYNGWPDDKNPVWFHDPDYDREKEG